MKFRIQPSERVGDEIRRIVFELIDHAKSVLTPRIAETAPQRVHEARKSFKKVRAVIRLVRSDLGVDLYRAENRWFRDAGRQLAHLRDADAMLEAIHRLGLQIDATDQEARAALERASEFFLEQRETAQFGDGINLTERVRILSDDLAIARRRVSAWPLWSDGFDAIGFGFQRTYGQARRAFLRVRREHPTHDRVHEWRKRTKYHWYHIRLFDNVARGLLTPYRVTLDSLSTLLGEHQDLAVLGRTIAANPEEGAADYVQVLLDLAKRRQAEIRDQARIEGERVFAERPGALRRRLEVYWQAWLVESGEETWPEPAGVAVETASSGESDPIDTPDDDDDFEDRDGGAEVTDSPPVPPTSTHESDGTTSERDISVAELTTILGASRRMVYQWIRRQWITPRTGKPYRFAMVEVERLRSRLEEQQTTRDLCEQVMYRRGVSYDAARAWVARRRRTGMTDAEIVRALPPRQPAMSRKPQRFAEIARASRESISG